MSDDPMHTGNTNGADPLRELGKQLPYERPDAARRDAVRSSLLIAASEGQPPGARNRWLLVGGGFAAGALAAAAVAVIVVRGTAPSAPAPSIASIESSSSAELQRSTVTTQTGTDELVRVRSGTVRLAVPSVRSGDHVRLQTSDAEVEGAGAYEVVVTADALARVTVARGTATIRVKGQQQAVFLAAGETWRAPVITADLGVATPPPAVARKDLAGDPVGAPGAPIGTPSVGETTHGATSVAPLSDVPSETPTSVAVKGDEPIHARVAIAPHVVAPIKPGMGDPRVAPAPRVVAPIKSATRDKGVATGPRVVAPIKSATSDEGVATAPRVVAPATSGTSDPRAATPDASPAVASRPAITATVEPAAPAPTGSSPTETHFRAGYALLRANKHADAAVELGKAADGDGALATDARYFQAVALTRAGRGAEAERALVQFIDRAATSTRRGRAAVMLGRLLIARGDRTAARAWFESALADPDPSVAAAAQSGLASSK